MERDMTVREFLDVVSKVTRRLPHLQSRTDEDSVLCLCNFSWWGVAQDVNDDAVGGEEKKVPEDGTQKIYNKRRSKAEVKNKLTPWTCCTTNSRSGAERRRLCSC